MNKRNNIENNHNNEQNHTNEQSQKSLNNKHDKKKFLLKWNPKILFGIAVAVLGFYYAGANYIFLENVDFSKVYTVRVEGDSEGAFISRTINTNYYSKLKEKKDKKSQRKLDFLNSVKIIPEYHVDRPFKNGDIADVEFKYDKKMAKKLKIRIRNTKLKIKIEGLQKVVKNINEAEDLKGFITKISQNTLEKLYDSPAVDADSKLIEYKLLPNIYYKQDNNGHLVFKYFISSNSKHLIKEKQKTSQGFKYINKGKAGISNVYAMEVKDLVLDKNSNITSYREDLFVKTYSSFEEAEEAMRELGYNLLY